LRFQWRAWWQRVETQHLEQLPPQLNFCFFNRQTANVVQAARRHFGGDAFQVIGRHLVPLRGGFLREKSVR
jgi:hypothetical protein